MITRQFLSRQLALPVLVISALLLSACGVNLSGEPEIQREAEIMNIPTTAPSATPDPAAASATPDASDVPESDTADDTADSAADVTTGDYDLGFEVYLQQCASCHGAADGVGPGLAAMHENAATRVEGMSGAAYVRESIVDPGAYIVDGYSDAMPDTFGDALSEDEIAGLVTFVLEFDPARMGMGGNTSGDAGGDNAPGDSNSDGGDAMGSTSGDSSGSSGSVDNPELAATSESSVGPELATGDTLTISGNLIAGTADGDPIPAGLPVQIYAVDPHGNIAGIYESESTDDQRFVFEDVARSVGMTYFIEVQYSGVPQGDRIGSIEGDETEVSTDITLYERTTDADTVAITWAEMLVNYAPIEQAGLEIWLNLEIANTGDTIVTTEERSDVNDWFVSVDVELPVAAFGIQPMIQSENSQRYSVEVVDNVPIVKDTWPLRPGQVHTITIAYYLPYENGAVIEHGFDYTVVDGMVLLPNDTVDFDSAQFNVAGDWRGRVTGNGTSVEALDANENIDPDSDFTLLKAHELLDPVPPDERVVFELDGRPTRTLDLISTNPADASVPGDDDDDLLPIILAALGVGILLIAGALFLRQRPAPVEADHVEVRTSAPAWRPPPPNASKADLLASLASLDDAYEAGSMDDETYYERRAILTERLMPLLDEDEG